MKNMWSILFAILACNIISLFVLSNDEHTYTIQQKTYSISQQHDYSTLNNDMGFSFMQHPESVAVINSHTEVVESNISAKNDTSSNNKFNHNNLRRHSSTHRAKVIAYNIASIGFSRAIDHYVYAFRHIII